MTRAISHEGDLGDTLRQMLAVLEAERQALAGLDLDAIVGTTRDKDRLCVMLDGAGKGAEAGSPGMELDEECRGLLEAARRLNEINRQVRNIIAANVATRLNTLTGAPQLYRAGTNYALVANRV
ncbi:flagellar protein FlgN [Novosphingobium sp. ZW T3_23]|uniref:flagellar protein FlgN n=1 Tax=Novosphingobium sp. ZW T3_23 TaxID=3378084 RepID=UPI00385409DF